MDPYEHIMDASRLCIYGEFDAQVDHIMLNVRLKRTEAENMRCIFDDLELIFQNLWPGCEVLPFGSIVTGLAIRSCDVECFVILPTGTPAQDQNVIQACNILKQHPNLFNELFAITCAKVPIVKFLHVPTNVYCAINFKNPAGVRNSQLLAFLFNLDNRALSLGIVIKYWSKIHKFTGVNLMSSYALTLLVVFYLQQIKIFPSVHELQKNKASFYINNWNMAFEDNIQLPIDSIESLNHITGGFFRYYSIFNFKEDIVSPFLGQPVKRLIFKDINNVPDEFSTYKNNVASNMCQTFRIDSKLCIQDPFEHSRNCAVTVNPKLVAKMITYIRFAARKYDEKSNDFLREILTEVPNKETNVVDKQKQISHNKVRKQNHNKFKVNNLNAWCEEINKLRIGKR